MRYKLRDRAQSEQGFTLIELLVVILIIGILAAIAIPSFLNQKSKASDAAGKELARTAQTIAESISTDHGGDYTSVTTTTLNAAEKSIPVTASSRTAFLSAASGSAGGYSVTATAEPSGDTFTVTSAAGVITRTCTGTIGGCVAGAW